MKRLLLAAVLAMGMTGLTCAASEAIAADDPAPPAGGPAKAPPGKGMKGKKKAPPGKGGKGKKGKKGPAKPGGEETDADESADE
jgi:hypothetical protein